MIYSIQSVKIVSKKSIIYGLLIILCCFISVVAYAQEEQQQPKPQCSQFCVHFCCKLLGVPLSMENVMELLPPKEGGSSMWEIKKTLEKIGLIAEGKRMDPAELLAGPYPIVAFVKEDHFVVVEKADEKTVTLLDGNGRRRATSTEAFCKAWGGKALSVTKPDKKKALPIFLKPRRKQPCLQFDTLFIDAGQIPDGKLHYTYEFPFENIGTGDLKIEEVLKSCKCVVAKDILKESIPPGGRGKITVQYNIGDRKGSFAYDVYVKTNDTRFPIIPLAIAGNSSQQLYTEPKRLVFDNRVDNEGDSATCYIRYTGDTYLELSDPVTDVDGLTVSCQRIAREMLDKIVSTPKIFSVDHHHLYAVEVRLDADKIPSSYIEGKVIVKTNLERYPTIEIPVIVKDQKPIHVYPSILYLGEVQPSSNISEEITLIAANDREFFIDSIDTGTTDLTCQFNRNVTQEANIRFEGTVAGINKLSDKSVYLKVVVPSLDRVLTIEVPVKVWYRSEVPIVTNEIPGNRGKSI